MFFKKNFIIFVVAAVLSASVAIPVPPTDVSIGEELARGRSTLVEVR